MIKRHYAKIRKPAPTDELDALAIKYDLTHRDYIFIECLLRDTAARKALENFCLAYSKEILDSEASSITK